MTDQSADVVHVESALKEIERMMNDICFRNPSPYYSESSFTEKTMFTYEVWIYKNMHELLVRRRLLMKYLERA